MIPKSLYSNGLMELENLYDNSEHDVFINNLDLTNSVVIIQNSSRITPPASYTYRSSVNLILTSPCNFYDGRSNAKLELASIFYKETSIYVQPSYQGIRRDSNRIRNQIYFSKNE